MCARFHCSDSARGDIPNISSYLSSNSMNASGELTCMSLSQKSMPSLLAPADCGTIHLRTYHAISQRRSWTCYEQSDAANTEGVLIPAAQADGADAARGRQTCVCLLAARAATTVLGTNILCAKSGDIVSMHRNLACEVLIRGELTQLQAVTSAVLATCNLTI